MLNVSKCFKQFYITGEHILKITGVQVQNNFSTTAKEHKVNVGEQVINYVKEGNGDKTLLCFPGALGSIWTDFKPQVNGLDRSKFTIIAWDPPGYGRSKPPSRKFTPDFYKTDADMCRKFMNVNSATAKVLGVKKFSLLGWSDGGISSTILAATYPDAVDKLVIWGSNAYVLPEELKLYEKIRDTRKWSAKMRQPMVELYGEEGFQKLWDDWCDAVIEIVENGGDICKGLLPSIRCPTLILHGKKDPMILPEHPGYLMEHIKNARLEVFEDGKHNIHLRYPQEFNAFVTKFLLE